MKNIIYLSFTILLLGSCDPTACADFIISNKSVQDLKIEFHCTPLDSLIVQSDEKVIYSGDCALGGVGLSFEGCDSIRIVAKDGSEIYKVYYPNTTNKNIYDTDNNGVWERQKQGKHNFDYTFEITNEDIN